VSDLNHIANLFQITSSVSEIKPWGNGHINDTYRVDTETDDSYILQRINTKVFKQSEELMQNVSMVTRHLQDRGYHELVAHLIPTKSGEFWINNEFGIWRMYPFIQGRLSLDVARSADDCLKAGQAFGSFLYALQDFPVNELHITIPKFHDIRYRLEQFEEALHQKTNGRIEEAVQEIEQVQKWAETFIEMFEIAQSSFPVRVTHNDTKLNNVLIGEGESGTVIDLDTVMPGYSFFDVGDALRSMAISALEDEANLESISLNQQNMNAFLNGYLSRAEVLLTKEELKLIPKSGQYMAYIMAVRFLTDFLNMDIYYKTEYPTHNLVRARNQLRVCELFTNNDV
jgi:Ser/Thr protein kinase RdoA (MazF antagonist)